MEQTARLHAASHACFTSKVARPEVSHPGTIDLVFSDIVAFVAHVVDLNP